MSDFKVKTSIPILIVVVLSSFYAAAQDHFPQANAKWDFSIWVAGETGEETTNSFAQSQIVSAGAFAGKPITGEVGNGWRRGSLEYGFDIMPIFITANNQSVRGGGFDPVILRWNSSLRTSRFAPYVELSGGGVATTANLPPGNTSNFNFMAKGGGGIYVFTTKRQSFDIAFQWSHISNANLGIQNPEFNGLQLRLGYHWYK